eukprot:13763224-Alexandrium_andersonii.AAC.1
MATSAWARRLRPRHFGGQVLVSLRVAPQPDVGIDLAEAIAKRAAEAFGLIGRGSWLVADLACDAVGPPLLALEVAVNKCRASACAIRRRVFLRRLVCPTA